MSAQFDDAEEEYSPTASTPTTTPSLTAPLAPTASQPTREIGRVDDPDAHGQLNSDGEYDQEQEEDEDDYYYSEEEGQWDLEQGMAALNSQDWAEGSGDFTKRYNRMRQHVVVTHAAQAAPRSSLSSALTSSSTPSTSSSLNPTARPLNILPATNRSRQPPRQSAPNGTGSTSSGSAAVHLNKVTDQLAHLGARYGSQLQLEPLYPTSAQATRKGGSEKILIKDKADRATNEQVLDPRTRLILFKMLGRELITRVDGCVSTGKEANVYHAMAPSNRHFALKIYKTSILIFKDRDRYVTGEFRFKSGYARSNPRKMVRLWAEKEMRNLRRLRGGGVRCPEPIEVRENVLVMEFMAMNVDKEGEEGEEWQASPRLKDAHIPQEDVRRLYIEILVVLRTIFMRCKLVHADFSEYNILYHNSHLHIIDVSQSVEQDHPSAFDFLRSDIKNADDFFARRGTDTLGLTRTFNFVTKPTWVSGRAESDEDMWEEAERIVKAVEEDVAEEEEEINHDPTTAAKKAPTTTKPTESDEAVFAQSYIPRALDQVYDIERDVARVLRGEGEELIYADITGVAKIKKMEGEAAGGGEGEGEGEGKKEKKEKKVRVLAEGEVEEKVEGEEDEDSGSESGSEESGSEEDDGEGGYKERRPRGKKHEDKDEKKKRRQETKEAAREKRSVKMKKGEKARRVKKSSGKK